MRTMRLWHIAIACTSIVLVALMLLNATGTPLVGSLATLSAYLVTWFAIGKRAWWSSRYSLALTVAIILIVGIGSAFTPVFASLLSFANPLFWSIALSLKRAIVANVALILAAAGGVVISVGNNQTAIVQVATFALLALVFSAALGLWFSLSVTVSRGCRTMIRLPLHIPVHSEG